MKKRILALALAGTTAFSVFGSAISANAYTSVGTGNTTDTKYNVDAYVSYEPVASEIVVTTKDAYTAMEFYDQNLTGVDQVGWQEYKSKAELTAYIYSKDIQEAYTDNVLYGMWGVWVDSVTGKVADYDADTKSFNLVAAKETDLATAMKELKIAKTTDSSSNAKYTVTYDNNNIACDSLEDALLKGAKLYISKNPGSMAQGHVSTQNGIDIAVNYEDLPTEAEYRNGISFRKAETGSTAAEGTVTVDGDDYTEWIFNSDMTGEASVYPFKVTSSLKTDASGNIYIDNDKVETPTVYAYDFIPETIPDSSVADVANYWNQHNDIETANALGAGTMDAEKGPGSATSGSIRYDVVSDWEDFLEELGLDKYWLGHGLNGYGFTEFCYNYTDRFYSDPQFDPDTGTAVTPITVDLYNIKGLLQDIWELRTAQKWVDGPDATYNSDGYYNANTSELIYLMQQYDKYIGNYIDKTEVASDDWGDLLLSILDAATEEDFKNASEYRRYTNTVEDLRTAYETATTTTLIEKAERNMYALLTSGNTKYSASKTTAVDKAALGDTLEGLYFNVGSAPDQYSVNPSTTDTNNVDYSNYNYYVAALSGKYGLEDRDTTLTFTSSLKKGYYSLYPMADYIDYDTTTPNEVYAGNTTATYDTYKGKLATEEYEWFWNVYQLAAKMNASGSGSSGNTKQGSVDAVNEALNEAVADLAVLTSPNSIELGAVEDALDKYAGKIESDYDEGYYAKYVQANDYAENVAEGLWQTRIAAMIAGVAGEALTYQGTQVTITKNDMKTVETAIKNGKTALEAIKADKDYNAAQVNALNKAIDNAQYLVDLYEGTYSTSKDKQSVNKQASKLVGDKDQMVKSDLTAAIEAIDAAINYSEIIMGWSKNDAGKWMYGTEEGYLNDGWHKIDKTWFYFNADDTAKQSEWFQENGTWYWFNSNCGAATGWAKVDGEWYFFKGNNAMKTGWEKVDGNWYYMASSGKMVTGWCEVNGKWYYFSKASNSLGQMLYSTTVDGYKLGADGAWIK